MKTEMKLSLVDHIHKDGGKISHHEDTEKVSRQSHGHSHNSLICVLISGSLNTPVFYDILAEVPRSSVDNLLRSEEGQLVVSSGEVEVQAALLQNSILTDFRQTRILIFPDFRMDSSGCCQKNK